MSSYHPRRIATALAASLVFLGTSMMSTDNNVDTFATAQFFSPMPPPPIPPPANPFDALIKLVEQQQRVNDLNMALIRFGEALLTSGEFISPPTQQDIIRDIAEALRKQAQQIEDLHREMTGGNNGGDGGEEDQDPSSSVDGDGDEQLNGDDDVEEEDDGMGGIEDNAGGEDGVEDGGDDDEAPVKAPVEGGDESAVETIVEGDATEGGVIEGDATEGDATEGGDATETTEGGDATETTEGGDATETTEGGDATEDAADASLADGEATEGGDELNVEEIPIDGDAGDNMDLDLVDEDNAVTEPAPNDLPVE